MTIDSLYVRGGAHLRVAKEYHHISSPEPCRSSNHNYGSSIGLQGGVHTAIEPTPLRSAQQLAEEYHLTLEPEDNKLTFINIPQYDPDKEEPLDNQFIRLSELMEAPNYWRETEVDIRAAEDRIRAIGLRMNEVDIGAHEERRRRFEAETLGSRRQEKDYNTNATYYANFLQFDFISNFDETKLKLLEQLFSQNTAENAVKNIKATKLLKEALSDKEWKELMQDHKVTIKSKKHRLRKYIVYEDPSKTVEVKEVGITTYTLCGIVQGSYPNSDKLATKIMAIKSDEDSYIAHSNKMSY